MNKRRLKTAEQMLQTARHKNISSASRLTVEFLTKDNILLVCTGIRDQYEIELKIYQTEEIPCRNTLNHVHSEAEKLRKALKKELLRLGIPDPLLNPSAKPLLDLGGGALLRPSPPAPEADGGSQGAAGAARFEVDRAEVIELDWAGLDICLANVTKSPSYG